MFTKDQVNSEDHKIGRALIGKRLICELAFDCGELDQWRELLFSEDLSERLSFLTLPSLAAVVTVGGGIYHYNQGEFWSAFPMLDTSAVRSAWGKGFEDFLKQHESLETFRFFKEQGALRYVAPILAHGGIPQSCLPDFFALITRYGDPEQSSQELIELLREHKNYMDHIDKPIQRFLLYGGEVSEEFVARVLALWESHERGDGGGTLGLPRRVVEAFATWYADHKPSMSQRLRHLPRPELRLKPGDLGVFLYLPRCDDHPKIGPKACWQALERKWAVTQIHEIPLALDKYWSVTCADHETLLEGVTEATPAIFFDPSTGHAIPNPDRRRLPTNLWIVYKKSINTEPTPCYTEELPEWPGFCIAVFDLMDCTYLDISDNHFEVRRPFFCCDDDPEVSGVRTVDNIPVFNLAPRIAWEGQANLTLKKDGQFSGNIDIEANELGILIDEVGTYDIILRGPLGQNIHKHFVLIPGLIMEPDPQVMWPDTKRIKWDVSVNHLEIQSPDGCAPPFFSNQSHIQFQAIPGDLIIDLVAEVPQLRWRLVMSDDEISEWGNKAEIIDIQDLIHSNYPRLVCELGIGSVQVDVSLVGKHDLIPPPQGRRSKVSQQNTWNFDLRPVRDEVEASGQAEKFELLVKSPEGSKLYCGNILTVRPQWDLSGFHVGPVKEENPYVIHVTWGEQGRVIAGRWLVLIPAWWSRGENILEHQLEENERSSYEWRLPLSDLRPGHYIVRALHAPWGRVDWVEAESIAEHTVDVNKPSWQEAFNIETGQATIENYRESLFAHWYRPELIPRPPPAPTGLTHTQVKQFLDEVQRSDKVEPLRIPRDGSGALNIFCFNPNATTEVIQSMDRDCILDIWWRILPSREIILLEPSPPDMEFIKGIAFQYHGKVLGTASKWIKQRHKRKYLSDILKNWHRNITSNAPSVKEVIFLCEKFRLSENMSLGERREYEKLKNTYQCWEDV